MNAPRDRTTLIRVLVRGALLAMAWSMAISLTGGVLFDAGPVRVSSRNPLNPLTLAMAGLAVAFALAPAGRRVATIATELAAARALVPAAARAGWSTAATILERGAARLPGSPGLPAVAAFALATGMGAWGMGAGALVAAGSDAYGYVSYGHLWGAGTLHVEPPWMRELAAIVGPEPLAPLGYRPSPDRTSMVPTYSPGLPMVMGLFERLWGRSAVFLAAPVLAGLAILATYLLGRRLGGPRTGLAAAALMASHPVFVHYLLNPPMSDLPAMAWWTLALALLASPSRGAALGAGLATGAAILTRPNLVPLALVPGLLLAWQALRARRIRGAHVQRLVLFAAGSVPACLALAWLNDHWYGSPLLSGYGPLRDYFSLDHLPVNLSRYPAWLLETTPLVAVTAALALAVRPRAHPAITREGRTLLAACAIFAGATFACYAFYLTFEGWQTLRFVAPALPPLLVLTCVGLAAVATRLQGAMRPIVGLLVAGGIAYGLAFSRSHSFGHDNEHRYARSGAYIAAHLPERAVLFSMLHSGSARYYANRPTIRYDFIEPAALAPAVEALRGIGYHSYVVLDSWEEDVFRERFAAATPLGRLDWRPVVIDPGDVRIYDISARDSDALSSPLRRSTPQPDR